MKLVKFSVSNFRSIDQAHGIPISGTTVLVGRNNEGKSNILKALAVAMNAIKAHSRQARIIGGVRYRARERGEDSYAWIRDYPISLQENNKSATSVSTFRLEFELEDGETDDFVKKIKSSLNGYLPIEVKIGPDNVPKIRVKKGGKGSKTLNSKSPQITEFIADRIMFNHIPAVRTHQQARIIIDEMISEQLSVLEDNAEYKEALNAIIKLERPILDELAKNIKDPLAEFLPNVKTVKISSPDQAQRVTSYGRNFDIIIDDGTPTHLEYKGDGVKSLAALGLLKNKSAKVGASVIAIEEPEAHLHPGAIHQLNEIISSLADQNQIVLTTHNPLFVNRSSIRSNIIVEDGKARPAKSIAEIRNLLGIKASDNLVNAQYMLVVEGNEDRVALEALLPILSSKVEKALKNHLMVIEPIGGASNLSYKLSLIQNSLCSYHVLLDHDDAGRKAFESAKVDGQLILKNTTFVNCQGMPDSEFEDCLDVDLYKERILKDFGVSLLHPLFKSSKKWSQRLKETFSGQGKTWSDSILSSLKYAVAECVKSNPSGALNPHKKSSIDALVVSLEALIQTH